MERGGGASIHSLGLVCHSTACEVKQQEHKELQGRRSRSEGGAAPGASCWSPRPNNGRKSLGRFTRPSLLSWLSVPLSYISPSVCSPPPIPLSHPPTHTNTHTNTHGGGSSGMKLQDSRGAVKTITGCQGEVVQEELSFNLRNASRHNAGVRRPSGVERDRRL